MAMTAAEKQKRYREKLRSVTELEQSAEAVRETFERLAERASKYPTLIPQLQAMFERKLRERGLA